MNSKTGLFTVFIFVIVLSTASAQFVTSDAAISEARFTGVWARETVSGYYTEILWFKELGVLVEFTCDGRITKAELLQVLAFLNGESPDRGKLSEANHVFFNIKAETVGKVYTWETRTPYTINGPFDYRFEGNKMYLSWRRFPERPFTKVPLN